MNIRQHLTEAATLVMAAILCAIVANAMASRDRKLQLVGNFPNATRVPGRQPDAGPLTRIDTSANMLTSTVSTTTAGIASPSASNTTAAATVGATTATPRGMANTSLTPTATASTPAPAISTSSTTAPKQSAPSTARQAAVATSSTAPPAARPNADSAAPFAPHEKEPYIEIHGDDVATLHAKGALFLDARRTSVYEDGHIAGARPFSVWESDIDDKVNKLFAERSDARDQAKPIVVYCTGGDCEDSHMLAQKLWGIQFNNVYVYKDGFPDWQKRGGAIRKGDQP